MLASNDFVDLIYHNRQATSATLRDFFSTLLGNKVCREERNGGKFKPRNENTTASG
jgi:hypothetical protein